MATVGAAGRPADGASDSSKGVSAIDDAYNEALASTAVEDDEGPAQRAAVKPGGTEEIPTILLVQAGLTVFNGVLVLICIVLWMIDLSLLASALRAGAGLALVLSMAPMGLGAYLERRSRQNKVQPPGMIWAHAGVYVGVIMCILTLLIPMIVTVRTIVGGY